MAARPIQSNPQIHGILPLAAIAAVAYLLLRQHSGGSTSGGSGSSGGQTGSTPSTGGDKPALLGPLDSRLYQVYASANPIQTATGMGIHVEGDRIGVLVTMTGPASVPAAVSMTGVRNFGNSLFGLIQPRDLPALGNAAGVTRVEADMVMRASGDWMPVINDPIRPRDEFFGGLLSL